MTLWTAHSATISAPAKLNLHLRVVGRRADGYHLLDSIVAPITLFDSISLRLTFDSAGISLRCNPSGVAPPTSENLAVRAAHSFLSHIRSSAGVALELTKRIPVGAGLGGGSSDAAAVLRGLNALLGDPLPAAELRGLALELGADVPLFLLGRPAHMTGIGEELEAWAGSERRPLVIAFSGVALSTREVYAKYDDLLTMSGSISSIRPPTSGQEPLPSMLCNDLEAAAFLVQPALPSLKQRLCSLGAEGVLMTGSGSAVFGYWRCWDDAQAAAEQLRTAGVWARVARVVERVPAVELTEVAKR